MTQTTKQRRRPLQVGRPPGMSEAQHTKIRAWATQPQTQARMGAWWAGVALVAAVEAT